MKDNNENNIMRTRIIIFIISLIALAIFYGCGSHSTTPVLVDTQEEIMVRQSMLAAQC